MGVLTGKYDDGGSPKGSRGDLFPQFMTGWQNAEAAYLDCNETARKLGLTPTQFALKFVESREFVTSNIIGATSLAQLEENIDAHEIDCCLLYTSPSPRDRTRSRMPSSA